MADPVQPRRRAHRPAGDRRRRRSAHRAAGLRRCAREMDARALIAYTPTGTRLGLELLAAERCDAALLHWGPAEESELRHPGADPRLRGTRPLGAGARLPPRAGTDAGAGRRRRRRRGICSASGLRVVATRGTARAPGGSSRRPSPAPAWMRRTCAPPWSVHSDRECAEALRAGQADIAPASRAAATEAGLGFVVRGLGGGGPGAGARPVLPHPAADACSTRLRADDTFLLAERLGGYDFPDSGRLVWAADERG